MFTETEYRLIWLVYLIAAFGLYLGAGRLLRFLVWPPLIAFGRWFVMVVLIVPSAVVEESGRMAPAIMIHLFDSILSGEVSGAFPSGAVVLALVVGLIAAGVRYLWLLRKAKPKPRRPTPAPEV